MKHLILSISLTSIITILNLPASAVSPEYLSLVDSAENLMVKEKWMQAEGVIISALSLEPACYMNSMLFSNLGVARTEQGKYKDAIEAFDLGLSINPKSTQILNKRARARMLLNDFDGALTDLSSSLEIDAIQEWSLQMRGMIYINRGETVSARKDMTLLAKNFHKNAHALSGLAKISELEGKNEDAIKYYDEAILINDDPDVRSERILLKIKQDKYSEASSDIRESLKIYPDYPLFYLWRGYISRLNYRYEEAEADKKIAIGKGLDPQFVEQFIPRAGR